MSGGEMPSALSSNDSGRTHVVERQTAIADEWADVLRGYDVSLWRYTHECSRLTLRAVDCIAQRPSLHLVFHDVGYLELPMKAHNVKARVANETEREIVLTALGNNYRLGNVVALCASGGRIFLLEYGYVQCLQVE